MCVPGQVPVSPASAGEALAVLAGAVSWLASADAGSLTAAEQAECLRALDRAQSMRTAARPSVLTAFTAQGGFEDDGHGSARPGCAGRACGGSLLAGFLGADPVTVRDLPSRSAFWN